jgi:hypothetical protein
MDPILGAIERDRAPLISRRELVRIHQTPKTGDIALNMCGRNALYLAGRSRIGY